MKLSLWFVALFFYTIDYRVPSHKVTVSYSFKNNYKENIIKNQQVPAARAASLQDDRFLVKYDLSSNLKNPE
jgi:hypothetical protein